MILNQGEENMPRSLWRLTIREEFCAAHALRHYQGKCERLHGHNYGVEATIEGESLHPRVELLLDFAEFKRLLASVLEPLDHNFLNEVEPFARINPSAENLSRHIWRQLQPLLPQGVRLHSVTVAEKGMQSATYMELPD
jgi:6-pyruvoyltetrahydropterin/6-carboxytetrahydropterin synthase